MAQLRAAHQPQRQAKTRAVSPRGARQALYGPVTAEQTVNASKLLGLQRAARNNPSVQRLLSIQAMASGRRAAAAYAPLQMEIEPKDITYIDKALANAGNGFGPRMAALGLAATWEAGSGRLTPTEIAALDGMRLTGKSRRNGSRMTTNGVAMARRYVAMLEILNDAVAFENNFNAKHTVPNLDDGSARAAANARNPKPKYNTVFDAAYFDGFLKGLARGVADGAYEITRRASDDGANNIKVLELHALSQRYRVVPLAIYQYKLNYRVTTDRATRTRTIAATHMETA